MRDDGMKETIRVAVTGAAETLVMHYCGESQVEIVLVQINR